MSDIPSPPAGYEEFVRSYSEDEIDSAILAALSTKHGLKPEGIASTYSDSHDSSVEMIEKRKKELEMYEERGIEGSLVWREYSSELPLREMWLEDPLKDSRNFSISDRRLDVEISGDYSIMAGKDTHEVLRKAKKHDYELSKVAEEIDRIKQQNRLYEKFVDEIEENGRRKQGLVPLTNYITSDAEIVPELMEEVLDERVDID